MTRLLRKHVVPINRNKRAGKKQVIFFLSVMHHQAAVINKYFGDLL